MQLGSLSQPGSGSCTTYTDFMQTPVSVQVGQTIPLVVTVGTCGTVTSTSALVITSTLISASAVVRAFADWNANGSFADPGDTLATSGVLTMGGAFSATIAVPANVPDNQLVRVRIASAKLRSI